MLVGGKSALSLHGVRHNLATRETLVLWADQRFTLPKWFTHRFPAIRWRLQNLEQFRTRRPAGFSRQVAALEAVLDG